jgi:hypothetical protein
VQKHPAGAVFVGWRIIARATRSISSVCGLVGLVMALASKLNNQPEAWDWEEIEPSLGPVDESANPQIIPSEDWSNAHCPSPTTVGVLVRAALMYATAANQPLS